MPACLSLPLGAVRPSLFLKYSNYKVHHAHDVCTNDIELPERVSGFTATSPRPSEGSNLALSHVGHHKSTSLITTIPSEQLHCAHMMGMWIDGNPEHEI